MKSLVVRKTTSLDLFGEYTRKKIAEGLLSEGRLTPKEVFPIVDGVFNFDTRILAIECLYESAIFGVDDHQNSFYLGCDDLIDFSRAPSLHLALP